MTKLRATGIAKRYSGASRSALKDINIHVNDGDFVSIVGESGAGKSTLLNILCGIDRPDSGEVFINDAELTAMKDVEISRLRGLTMGIVFQNGRLIDDLTVFENTALPGYLYRSRDEVESDVLKSLAGLNVLELRDRYPSELSAGQRQRVAMARALINSPGLLFLDEPTGNLDIRTARWVYGYLADLNKSGMTIIMITHDIYSAALAKRVWVISKGRIKKELSFENNESRSRKEKIRLIYSSMYGAEKR